MKIPAIAIVLITAYSECIAGVWIDMAPQTGASLRAGETVTMDVRLTQDPGGRPIGVRLLQLDFSDTSPDLRLGYQFDWNSKTVPRINSDNWWPGAYFIDGITPKTTIAYTGLNYPNHNVNDSSFSDLEQGLVPWDSSMLVVPAKGFTRIGSFEVTLPNKPGHYFIDAANSDTEIEDNGAILSFGFSVQEGDDQVFWRPVFRNPSWADFRVYPGLFYDANSDGVFSYRALHMPEPGTLALLASAAVVFGARKNTKQNGASPAAIQSPK